MDHHPVHAERIGDQTGMLPPCPAKAGKRVARHVMAPRDRDALDRIGHAGDGDGNEALSGVAHAQGLAGFRLHLRADGGDARLRRIGIERLVAIRAEQAGKMIGLDLAEQQVAVGDGERSAAPVAGRSRHRARRFRPDAEAAIDEAADRSAARRDGVDLHHRTGIMGHVGRGAAHVEADHRAKTGLFRGPGQADDAARRAGEDRVLAPEQHAVDQAAARLHEQHVGPIAQRVAQPVDIGAQHGRKIGVGQCGVAAPDQLDERRDVMAGRNLGKADFGGDRCDRLFVRGIAIAMHQHDGDRAQAAVIGRLQRRAGGVPVQRGQDRAICHDPFVHLRHLRMKRVGQDDVAREQVWPVLIADAQRVAKTARDGEQGRLALALQQGVGGDGGADPQATGRDRPFPCPRQSAHRLYRRVDIAFRVAGQQFGGVQPPIGAARHHIGESTAAIDPELPLHGAGDGAMLARWQGFGDCTLCIGACPARCI